MEDPLDEFLPVKLPKIRRMRPEQPISQIPSEEKYDIPTVNPKNEYKHMHRRHHKDYRFTKDFDFDAANADAGYYKYESNDKPDILTTHPSYTKFKIPFDVLCNANYRQSFKKYNNQFRQEIDRLIENQPCAREAAYFIRIISYTTLWPPYHSVAELNRTSQTFFSLTAEEKKRFRLIMGNDFI